jgi:hypothetical protein
MAINVNTVYQTVLAILNKEQRGYMTPNEFNRIATQVQLEIFESYFPDADQANRKNQNNTQNDTAWFNAYENALNLVEPFIYRDAEWTGSNGNPRFSLSNTTITDLNGREVKQVGNVSAIYNNDPGSVLVSGISVPGVVKTSVCEKVSRKDYEKIIRSKLTAPTYNDPVYYIDNWNSSIPRINVFPSPTLPGTTQNSVFSELIVQPLDPIWGYTIDQNVGAYLYSSLGSVNFELNPSEQNKLILKILFYAGVVINDPQIIQVASSELQQEKVNEKS